MPDFKKIRETVERVVAEVVDARMAELRQDVIARVSEGLEPAFAVPPGGSATDLLSAAVTSVQEANSQADILKAMLDGATSFCGRCGLLILRGTTATGWQARGFSNNDAFRAVSVDGTGGLTARVLQSRVAASAAADEFDANFAMTFGAPSGGSVTLFPLVIKEKIAALLYADAGTDAEPKFDNSALDLLVRSTGLWVELLALRRSAGEPATPVSRIASNAPAAVVASPSQPVTAATPASAPEPNRATAAVPVSASAPVEDEVHNKARRFAKLLVDEIKLYNQAKVSAGRQNRNLYDQLKDDIDKSRATYERRYGQAVTDVDYFRQELVRVLADNDASLLGNNFPQ